MKSIFVFMCVLLYSNNIFAAVNKHAEVTKSKIGFIDIDKIMTDTAIGRACTNNVQVTIAERQHTIAQMNDAAKKAKPSETAAKLEEIHNFELMASQDVVNARNACTKNVYATVKNESIKILNNKHLELIIAELPLAGGVDITDDLIRNLNAANIDAITKLEAVTRENEELKKRAAEKPTIPTADKK